MKKPDEQSKANEQTKEEAESQIQGLNKCLPEGENQGMSEMAEGSGVQTCSYTLNESSGMHVQCRCEYSQQQSNIFVW